MVEVRSDFGYSVSDVGFGCVAKMVAVEVKMDHSAGAKEAVLYLSCGQEMRGRAFGAPLRARGELVFTTSLVGYPESLSDPSYFGQILIFSYPLMGNYGLPSWDLQQSGLLPPAGYESSCIYAAGVIVCVESQEMFHWNSMQSLHQWLCAQNVPGMCGVDTRHLISQVREHVPLLGRMESAGATAERGYKGFAMPSSDVAAAFFDASEHQILPHVSTTEPVLYTPQNTGLEVVAMASARTLRVVVVDCGVKANIIRMLLREGCEVLLVPWDVTLSDLDCSGWVFSNGPGDPMQATSLIRQIPSLLTQDRPILGICLGHQLLGIAAGMTSERMRYGHRSHNQPVYIPGSRKGYVTSQNHGFHLVEGAHWPEDWEVWFRNANDQSIEGIRHRHRPFSSVQFHPESCGGPRDTGWIITDFVSSMRS